MSDNGAQSARAGSASGIRTRDQQVTITLRLRPTDGVIRRRASDRPRDKPVALPLSYRRQGRTDKLFAVGRVTDYNPRLPARAVWRVGLEPTSFD